MESLEDGHRVAHLGEVARTGETGRTGADDSHLDPLLVRTDLRCGYLAGGDLLSLPVGDKALQEADRHGRIAALGVDALRLALLLLRTDATTDSGEGAGLVDYVDCFLEVSPLDILDEGGDIDRHGAALHTGGLGAVDAALSLCHSSLSGDPESHLLIIVCADLPILGRHDGTRKCHPLLRLQLIPQISTPGGLAPLFYQFVVYVHLLLKSKFASLFFCSSMGLKALRRIISSSKST